LTVLPETLGDLLKLFRRAWRRPTFRVASTLALALTVLGLLGPYVAPYPLQGLGVEVVPEKSLLPPSPKHLLGTDAMGRDVLSRVLFGLWRAIVVTLLVITLSTVLGLLIGSVAAILPKPLETVLVYTMELLISIPSVLLAAALVAAVGGGLVPLTVALVVTWWPWYGRVAYTQARALRELDFVNLPRLFGLSRLYVVRKHIVPHIVPPVLVEALSDLGSVVIEMSTITFIFGAAQSISEPDLGVMVGLGLRYLTTHPWVVLSPALFLALLAVSFTVFGEVLYEEANPVLRKRWFRWF
jgi:peptide/nickel transport system permease protein